MQLPLFLLLVRGQENFLGDSGERRKESYKRRDGLTATYSRLKYKRVMVHALRSERRQNTGRKPGEPRADSRNASLLDFRQTRKVSNARTLRARALADIRPQSPRLISIACELRHASVESDRMRRANGGVW